MALLSSKIKREEIEDSSFGSEELVVDVFGDSRLRFHLCFLKCCKQ